MSDCTRFEERVVEALEGELDDHALAAHAEGCRTCQNTLRSYRLIQESYRGVPTTDVAPEVAQRILAAARERRPAVRSSPVRRRLLVAAAVLAAVLIPLFIWLGNGERDPVADLVQQGDAQRAAGELERAEASYGRALAAADLLLAHHPAPDLRKRLLLVRAEVLELLGRREEALAAYRSLVREFPEVARDIAPTLQALGGLQPEVLRELEALGYGGVGVER
jgi:tetratricopeptide (TPR) repeat protein